MKFKEDFDYFVKRIFVDKTPTAFSRYADGEHLIIQGSSVGIGTQATDIDKWTSFGKNLFSVDLENTLHNKDKDYFYAISCSCCDSRGSSYYNSVVCDNKTFANLWINSNFSSFKEVIKNINEEVVMIANAEGRDKEYPFVVKKYFPIQNDIVNYYIQNKDAIISQLKSFCDFSNTLVFVSAGPFSEIVIDTLWKYNNTNRYIDIGSSLSDIIHGKIVRPYMVDDYYSKKVCVM